MSNLLRWLEIPGQQSRISAMEGLRAYAAGIVFLLHCALLFGETFHIPLKQVEEWTATTAILKWMEHSHHGVDLFFLLSGYLIAGIIRKSNFRFGSFLAHRVTRIYPTLIATLMLYTAALYFLRGEIVTPIRFVQNLFLLNGAFGLEVNSITYVTWSIFFEFAFYCAFPVLFAAFGLRGAILAAMIVIAAIYHFDTRYAEFAMFLAGVWLKFNPGITLKIPSFITLTIYLGFTTITAIAMPPVWAFIAMFAFSAFLLADNALHSNGIISRFFSLRPLRLLGNISYSFYLLHPAGLLAIRYVIEPLNLHGFAWATAVVIGGFAMSVVMAAVSFICLERPYFLLRHSKVNPEPVAVPTPAT